MALSRRFNSAIASISNMPDRARCLVSSYIWGGCTTFDLSTVLATSSSDNRSKACPLGISAVGGAVPKAEAIRALYSALVSPYVGLFILFHSVSGSCVAEGIKDIGSSLSSALGTFTLVGTCVILPPPL